MVALSQIGKRFAHLGVQRNTHLYALLRAVSTNKDFTINNFAKNTSQRFMSSKHPEDLEKSAILPKNAKDIVGKSLHTPAGPLHDGKSVIQKPGECDGTTLIKPDNSDFFIPQVKLFEDDGRRKKRVLVLCTGGTLTMAPDPNKNGALAPVEGAVTTYMKEMNELLNESMPEVVVHEYTPFYDSSDLGPSDWAVLASDIQANYWHFDGFVCLMGTDTMAYADCFKFHAGEFE